MSLNAIGICYFPHFNYIDHIVPLCQILDIPVLCADPICQQTIKFYYPNVKTIYEPDVQRKWTQILGGYDTLVYAEFYRRFQGSFEMLNFIYPREMRSTYCPHGNSDKGQKGFWMERFADEDTTLIYGSKMRDFLDSKGVWDRLKNPIFVGNFRNAFYKEHQKFFDEIVKAELFPAWRKKENKINLLYMPTMQTPKILGQEERDFSSFFMAYSFLFNNLPKEYRLFVRLHPNLYTFYENEIEAIKQQYDNDSIHFVDDCPLIYPLLAQMDAYIGDLSSVGYDFLTFNRPMFFLNAENRDAQNDPGLYLYRCGVEINPQNFNKIYEIISSHLEDLPNVKEKRKQMYDYTFANDLSLKQIKKNIIQAC